MSGILAFLRRLFSLGSSEEPIDTDAILDGRGDEAGVITVCDRLTEWKEEYENRYIDYLTVREALRQYETAMEASEELDPLLDRSRSLEETVVDAATTVDSDIQAVMEFIERREEYNDEWLDRKKETHATELNSYFDDPEHSHTAQQLRAIFSNDNFNRVNAAAGTGKTTTFGRRVHFILSEYDDVAASDLLAFTFTRNGRDEMKTELDETFDITGVDVRTINSYSKSVAEDHHPNLEFVVGEARTTELAAIWREIQSDASLDDIYERFMDAWKEDHYDPDDIEVVEGVYESLTKKSTVTIRAEDVHVDDIPEEGVAHQAIAQYLTSREIEYDYQCHLDWASSPSGGYVLDFKLLEPVRGETIYIEYCSSEETRNERLGYRNIYSERPETIRRLFSHNPKQNYDPAGKSAIVLDGEQLLEGTSDRLNWDDQTTQARVTTAIQNSLEDRLQQLGVDVSSPLSGQDLKDHVYDYKVLTRDVVEMVDEFITQARVREWGPERAEQEVTAYLESEGDDIDDGVPEFVELCLEAYRAFRGVFDNETKTDFHGSVVLTRDLLKAGEVQEDYLYSHIFVDEMQDLNRVQFGVVKHLAKQQQDVRTFGVGDDWQSIFGFQGARPDLFINFGEELGAGEYDSIELEPVEVFTDDNPLLSEYTAFADTRLEENHRCPETVVKASNEVIRNNEVRTDKQPSGLPGGNEITIHHLGCDTFANKLDQSMTRKIDSLIEESPYKPSETQVLLRQKDGDPTFYYPLEGALPDGVDIRTAHDAKGSQAENVIIPKVVKNNGYPSIRGNKWVDPVKRPPKVYEDKGVSYQLEEERRLFYVALTRAKTRLDVLTVQGAESVFIEELPDRECEHRRPLSEEELTTVETERELRRAVTGIVDARPNDYYATFDWADRGLVDLNLYDATPEQKREIDRLAGSRREVTLANCGIQYRESADDGEKESHRLQLQLDSDVSIQE